jgi:hypothetical protein
MKLRVFDSVVFISGTGLTLGDILPLPTLIHRRDSDLTIRLFQTGSDFFNHSVLLGVSLPIWLHMFLFRMRDVGDAASFFRFLLEKGIELSPDAIAFGCWSVFHLNRSDPSRLFHLVQLHCFPPVKSSLTMFWPFVLAIESDNKLFFRVIAASAGDHWFWLFPMVEIIGYVLQTNYETIHSQLFPLVFDGLLEAGACFSSFFETPLF